MIKLPGSQGTPHGILRRTAVSFALIFILPSLIFVYLWDKIQGNSYPFLFLSTLLCMGLGFSFVWELVRQTLALTQQAKELATGKIPAFLSAATRPDELGELGLSIQNIAQNVELKMHELQRTAEALEHTKKALSDTTIYAESVIRSMADAMIVLDRGLKIKSVNRSATELLGFTQSELLGRELQEFMDQASDEDERLLRDLSSLGKGMDTLYGRKAILLSSSGERIPVDVTVSALQQIGTEVLGGVMIARDMRKGLTLITELERANVALEEKVKARTSEMEQAYRQIKEKDAQIFHQEKMVSVGLLAAGIAHEINNPIGYINSNLDVLGEYLLDIRTYTQGLEQAVEAAQRPSGSGNPTPEMERAASLRRDLKIDEVPQDAENLLKESKNRTERVKRIVVDLRNFSHADENRLEEADVNQGIESTLNIVWNEIKYRAKVDKSYGNIPKILCYPQQLNQVFMNLLVNAAQAIETKGEIRIRTHHDGEHIHIEISDNGIGIPPENLQKIFDPFFTTKAVGKGTGLGLSIAYSIIEKHHGKIDVTSAVGKGTTFAIKLPLNSEEGADVEDPHDSHR